MVTDLLDGLLDFLSQQLEGVEFCRAWGPGWGSRLVEQPVVSGEVLSSQWTGEQGETVIRLSVFAPEARALRETADGLEQALRQSCPGCVGLLREEEGEDSQTRLHCLSLRLTFPTGDANGYEGIPVELGGKSYRVTGVSVAMSLSGKELVAIGEGIPFAVEDARWEYQVELRGIQAAGLERLAVFTAQIGDARYTGCRWKKLDLASGTAVFLASGCEGKEDLA